MGPSKIVWNKCACILVGQEVIQSLASGEPELIFRRSENSNKRKNTGRSKISFILYSYTVENSPIMNRFFNKNII